MVDVQVMQHIILLALLEKRRLLRLPRSIPRLAKQEKGGRRKKTKANRAATGEPENSTAKATGDERKSTGDERKNTE